MRQNQSGKMGTIYEKTIETETFRDRGVSDYMQYLVEEKKYTIF